MRRIAIGLVGPGLVGKSLLQQLYLQVSTFATLVQVEVCCTSIDVIIRYLRHCSQSKCCSV